jgi:hypothetical protein
MTYPDGAPGHVRDYNFRELKNTLAGFDIIKEATDARLPKTLGRSVIVLARNQK